MANEFDIDLSNPDNLNQKPLDEKETRKRFLNYARSIGKEKELLIIFAKYDKLLRLCTDDKERKDMSKYACYEVYSLLGKDGQLFINGDLYYTHSIIK